MKTQLSLGSSTSGAPLEQKSQGLPRVLFVKLNYEQIADKPQSSDLQINGLNDLRALFNFMKAGDLLLWGEKQWLGKKRSGYRENAHIKLTAVNQCSY